MDYIIIPNERLAVMVIITIITELQYVVVLTPGSIL